MKEVPFYGPATINLKGGNTVAAKQRKTHKTRSGEYY